MLLIYMYMYIPPLVYLVSMLLIYMYLSKEKSLSDYMYIPPLVTYSIFSW